MLVQMLLRRGQALLRSAMPSFAGTGLLERMRSTAVALLGVTAAMALGLVALALQQDWPLPPPAPIPGIAEPAKLGDARVAAQRPDHGPSSRATATEPGRETAAGTGGSSSAPAPQTSQVSESRQLATAPPQGPPEQPATGSPAAQEAPAAPPPPAPSAPGTLAPPPPSNPATAPSAPAVPSPPSSEPVVVSGVKDGGDDDDYEDDDDAKVRGKSYGKYKQHGGWRGGKPAKDDDSDADLAVPPPAPPPPPPTTTPTVPDGSAEEEVAEDAGYQAPTSRGKGRGHGSWRFGR